MGSPRVASLAVLAVVVTAALAGVVSVGALEEPENATATATPSAASPTAPTPTPIHSPSPTASSATSGTATASPTPAGTASPTPTPSPTVSSTPHPDAGGGSTYTLAELRDPGRQLDNAPASVRIADPPGLLIWLKHVPAGSLAGPKSRKASVYTSPSTVVKRNSVLLRANLVQVPDGGDDMTAVVSTYRVRSENGTQYATNVTVSRQQVTLSPGFYTKEIDLPQVSGDPKEVTVWLLTEDGERVATWHFQHRSAATTQDAPLSASAGLGELVAWAFLHVGLWVLLGAVLGVVAGAAAVKTAYTGPGADGIGTILILSIPSTVVLALTFFNLVELFVTNSWLFAFPAAGIAAVLTVMVSPGTETEKWELIRPELTEVESPSGGQGVDWDQAKDDVIRVADTDTGKTVVEGGWLPFIARIYGGASEIKNMDQAKAFIRLPDSSHDQLHILAPSARFEDTDSESDLINYTSPSLAWRRPESLRGMAMKGLPVATAGLLGWALYPGQSLALGVIAAGVVAAFTFAEGTDGEAVIPWGSRHHRRAWATASEMAEGMDAADTAEEAEKLRLQESAKTERKSREKAADYESEFLSEILGVEIGLGERLVDAPGGDGEQNGDHTDEIAAAFRSGEISAEEAVQLLGGDAEVSGEGVEPGDD